MEDISQEVSLVLSEIRCFNVLPHINSSCTVYYRVDAQKLLCQTRRCVPERAQNIGIWLTILELIAWIAVITNVSAFLTLRYALWE